MCRKTDRADSCEGDIETEMTNRQGTKTFCRDASSSTITGSTYMYATPCYPRII